ncbi:RNA-binding protein [Streptomyces tateyamensis]|uniref:RNA-binding protein n=1 Tax=Streptomyces tateyamensis TaxID=565073 RepID=A0A2V4NKG5_9ACTN|nr:S1 RNA-binding domain-containing protein [Streptomyces tateyamensis]PYC72349.1 RNA-binding protein [Streptomyces tateyamensis]
MLPYVYRITKYNPADRDERGYYMGAVEAVSDHGSVEAAYLEAVAAFAEDTGVRQLSVREPQAALGFVHFGLEPAVEDGGLAGLFPSDLTGFHDGAQVPVPVGLELVRAMLRDSGAWCRLEVEDTFAVHVGWDQYVYVGSNVPCEAAVARTRELGLFPEPLDASPYEAVFDEPGEQRPADDVFWARVRWCVAMREAALLEEMHLDNASRWHRLGGGTLDAVRVRLTPRARLAVWPDLLSTDVAAVVAGLPDEGLVECVWEDQDGRITSTVADETEFPALAAQVRGARAAAVLPMDVDERSPLFTAVLPDGDGVLRARWRTEPTPSDRDWAFLKTLRRGRAVTGTVTEIASFGVTFVDLGGFTAMINIPELSWRHINHPADILTVGQEITAEILDVDMVRERVPLSLKALQEDPLPQVAQQVGKIVTGPVTKIVPSGAFVRIEDREDGFEGLVHNTELSEPPADRPEDVVQVGDLLTVKIIDVDPTRRRIALSHTQARATSPEEHRHVRR